jgi:PAS domain-containing protein
MPPAECGCLYGELARAEAACRDRERWLTSLLAELPAAVLLADAHSQVVGVNQAYCDLFDLAEAPVDLVGTDCRLLLRPRAGLVDDPAGFADRLDTLLRRRRTLRREAVMFADGRVFERSHLPLVSPDGYRGHLWLYVDVTDRRILDAEIEGLISEL